MKLMAKRRHTKDEDVEHQRCRRCFLLLEKMASLSKMLFSVSVKYEQRAFFLSLIFVFVAVDDEAESRGQTRQPIAILRAELHGG